MQESSLAIILALYTVIYDDQAFHFSDLHYIDIHIYKKLVTN